MLLIIFKRFFSHPEKSILNLSIPQLYVGIVIPGQYLKLRVRTKNQFSYFSIKIYVVGTQKNRLNETVLLSTPKHMLKPMGKKIFTILFI